MKGDPKSSSPRVSFRPWTESRRAAYHKGQEARIEQEGIQHFVHPGDLIDAREEVPTATPVLHEQQDLILRIFAWIARGPTAEAWGRRAWVATYYLRPALCGGKSAADFARRCGVKRQLVVELMALFRAEFKEVNWPDGRSRNGRTKADTSEAEPAGSTPHPPGKESFYNPT